MRKSNPASRLARRALGACASAAALACLFVPQASAQNGGPTRIARVDGPAAPAAHPLAPAVKYVRSVRESLQQIRDYEADFHKTELVGGAIVSQQMQLKLRNEPFAVYLKYVEPNAGREVLYVDGVNEGKLLARDKGIKSVVGAVSLDPTGRLAMEGNRYPVTRIGLVNLVDALLDQWEREAAISTPIVKYYPDAKVGNVECKVIESTQPNPGQGIAFHRTRIFLDKTTNLPVRLQQFAFPNAGGEPILVEQYTYLGLRTNVGLGDRDFDRRNPNYGF